MKRYELEIDDSGYCNACMVEDDNGSYIEYDDYIAEKAFVVKPMLSEVLSEMEPMIVDFVESHNEDAVREYLREKLGKYFA